MKTTISPLKNFMLTFFLFYLFSIPVTAQSTSLVVLDSEFSKRSDVLTSIPPEIGILELNGQTNPWKAIRERLESDDAIQTIHLFAPANYNALQMGGITYDMGSLGNEFELSMLEGLYQGVNFQLLVYDCNLGSNEEGIQLLKEIGQRAYFNVAVCTDCTSIFDDAFSFNYTTIDEPIDGSIIQN